MLFTLYLLGVLLSFSCPRVSDDNAFIESFFKTLKYMHKYPGRFSDIVQARSWMAEFVHWYNTDHRHSGIGYITPEQRHSGKIMPIMQFRNEVLKKACENHPERWNGNLAFWSEYPVVLLNPSLETRRILKERKSS